MVIITSHDEIGLYENMYLSIDLKINHPNMNRYILNISAAVRIASPYKFYRIYEEAPQKLTHF